jgi:hypothetical protein
LSALLFEQRYNGWDVLEVALLQQLFQEASELPHAEMVSL